MFVIKEIKDTTTTIQSEGYNNIDDAITAATKLAEDIINAISLTNKGRMPQTHYLAIGGVDTSDNFATIKLPNSDFLNDCKNDEELEETKVFSIDTLEVNF